MRDELRALVSQHLPANSVRAFGRNIPVIPECSYSQ
jgi:hypothetical protein